MDNKEAIRIAKESINDTEVKNTLDTILKKLEWYENQDVVQRKMVLNLFVPAMCTRKNCEKCTYNNTCSAIRAIPKAMP